MPNRLRIQKLEWSNFLSYGNYETSLELDKLGPVLIVGQHEASADQSNGAGKTGIGNALIWCLFGRLPRKAAPGDKVINWQTKSDCWVRATTDDGWVITRTRKSQGHDDLIIQKDGADITLSTNLNAQQFLKKTFNLDYDIFVSSVFCGQFSDSFLQMSDQKRKATLERLLGLTKLNVLGDVAKEKKDKSEIEQKMLTVTIDGRQRELDRMQSQINNTHERAKEFEEQRVQKVNKLEADRIALETSSKVALPDLTALKVEWEEYKSVQTKINDLKLKIGQIDMAVNKLDSDKSAIENAVKLLDPNVDVMALEKLHRDADQAEQLASVKKVQLDTARLDKRKAQQDIEHIGRIIAEWESKAGKECPSCKQSIPEAHAHSLSQPYVDKKQDLVDVMTKVNSKIEVLETEVSTANECALRRPEMTVEEATDMISRYNEFTTKIAEKVAQKEKLIPMRAKVLTNIQNLERSMTVSNIEDRLRTAEAVHEKYRSLLTRITDMRVRSQEEKDRPNPYTELKAQLQTDLDNAENALRQDREKMIKLDAYINQMEYIRRSYHDRNKIKMFILSGIIPTLNQRIEYYLNAFDCDFELKFTPTLSVETGWWDYEYHSGGECKRIDLAVMFALYDVYISLYGAQCNVMVLDEVDGSLDPVGVRSFVDVINNDFAGDRPDKPDTILIISHKKDMVDQFPSQVLVTMDQNRFSHLSVS
jgi:DNA repair exonuclease SbcCD ATPase subunit